MNAPRLDIDPFDEVFLADPYAHHDTLRDAGPVVWLQPVRRINNRLRALASLPVDIII